ncbi:MAG: hypothetical protein U0T73_13435, partial [Chitinophagales bacterium]
MKSFLDEIAYALVEKHQGNLRDVVVIVPNNRVSVFLRKALQKHLEGRGWLPELIPFADFIGNDSPLAVLPNASLIAMLYEIYAEQKGGDLFEHFIPTAQTMLADFNELDSQLANPEQFFRDLQHLKALNFFLEDQESLTPFQLNYQAFWKIFEGCYFGLKEKLLANGAAYSGLMYRTQAEDRAWLANYRGLHLYFVGFSLFSKSEETIVRHCMDAFHAEVWSDTDRWYTENQMHEAGAYFRELRKKWKLEPSPFQGNFIRETPRKVEIVGTAKNIGQAVAAGAVLQQFQNSGKTTAVILPDEKLLQPLMAALPDNESVNITMGLPLKETAIADFVRYWLDMHLQAGKNKRRRFYHKDVLQLLQHPFTEQLLAHKNSAADCQTEIVRKNKISLTAADLEKLLENEPQLFQLLFQMPEDHLQLLSAIEQLLLQLLKNEAQLEVIHDREPVAIEKLLDTVRHLQWHTRNWKDHIAISSFIPLLLHELKTVRIPFESDQTEGIQLMGIFETRALDFDQVVILACNEGILPPSKKSNSFIPYEMRKAYELSTSDESDSTYSYLFYRLMQRAEQVVLLYNTE